MTASFRRALWLLFLFAASAHAAPTFTKESSVQFSSATPQAFFGLTPDLTMYFVRDNIEVRTATSTDGLTFGEVAGVRLSTGSVTNAGFAISSITACTVLRRDLTPFGYYMLYSAHVATGSFHIASATSTDGVTFAHEVTRFTGSGDGTTFLGSPRLIELADGNWRLYFTQDSNGGNDAADRTVFTSLSQDEGATWSAPTPVFSSRVGEIFVSTLTSGAVRLYYTAPAANSTVNTQVLSARSNASGTSFTTEGGVRLSTAEASGSIAFPAVVRSSETFRWRMHYGFMLSGATIPFAHNALTLTPDPQTISPSSVFRSDPARTFTVFGEIFDSTPTAVLRRSGLADIPGTSVSRTDDQTLTAVFDTEAQALGNWSVVVTNADGHAGQRAGILTITFAPGSATLLDNLMRPRTGTPTTINITTFEDGHVRLLLYTLDGQLVKTIFDGQRTAGNFSTTWDGRSDQGNLVASGTYLLKATGPKLETYKKIVVIK